MIMLSGFCSAVLGAANVTVTDTGDSGAGTLRQALVDVDSRGIITFDPGLSGQTITLSGEQLKISKSLSIDASMLVKGITISGDDLSRVFRIADGTTVELNGLRITGGRWSNNGGGIHSSADKLTVRNCTIDGNQANLGAGIYNFNATTTVINSTMTNNVATANGGAIYNWLGRTKLIHCTITGNTGPAGSGGGVASYNWGDAETVVTGSIICGNTGGDVDRVSVNSFTSGGFNLIGFGDAIGAFNQSSDQTMVLNPQLAPLGSYGGATPTINAAA